MIARSRNMPPRGESAPSPVRYVFLAALAAGLAVFVWREPKVAAWVMGLFAAFVVVLFLVSTFSDRRLEALAEARSGGSICTFARALPKAERDTFAIRAVYEEVGAAIAIALPLRPSDRLEQDLQLDAGELHFDIIAVALKRAGRAESGGENNPHSGRVETVGDLVRFVAAPPRP